MFQIDSIDKQKFITLINSDVYAFVDKSTDTLHNLIFEAATSSDPTVVSLERFFYKYRHILKNASYTVLGENYGTEEIIKHIRLDDEVGRVFIDKLLYKAIITETDI